MIPRKRRTVALAVAAALALALGIGSAARAQAVANASTVRELTSGGLTRTYRAFHPASAGAHPALVVMLHGGFGTGTQAEGAYGWDAAASRSGFVVAYPDGIGRAWNAGRCCGRPFAEHVDDVAFITAVIRDAETRDGIDPARVYVTGMSNGAIMAYRMACESPVRIAAIGPVAGDLEVPCDRPLAPVSVMAIHGTADGNVPFDGGYGTKGVTHTDHLGVAGSLARWRAIDRCAPADVTVRSAVRTERTACAGETEVVVIAVEGAGHQWPGAKPPPPAAARLLGLDQPSTALDATATLWGFFERHIAAPASRSSAPAPVKAAFVGERPHNLSLTR
jgi:polyhydroxybutyrate depolymerase